MYMHTNRFCLFYLQKKVTKRSMRCQNITNLSSAREIAQRQSQRYQTKQHQTALPVLGPEPDLHPERIKYLEKRNVIVSQNRI